MSEVQSRPSAPRGRGSSRGRGGFSNRGGRNNRTHTNGDKVEDNPAISIEDDSEVGQLKKKYGNKVGTIQDMFPDWTDEDVVYALQETGGDLETTVNRIATGAITQWGEVSKAKKDRSRSKVKDAAAPAIADSTNLPRAQRGGRGDRGGRGRGSERGGRGRGRGASAAQTNGTRKENSEVSVPTVESTSWDTSKIDSSAAWDTGASGTSGWDTSKDTTKPAEDTRGSTAVGAAYATAATAAAQVTSSIIPDGVKKSWASMFAPAPVPKKAPEPVAKPTEPKKPEEPAEIPVAEPEAPAPTPAVVEPTETPPVESISFDNPEPTITPSKDELTQTNLEQVLDTSNPKPTATAASTAASSWDPRNATSNSTPYSALQQGQAQAIRPPTSGFQASALKATGSSGRTPSYQRRVLDQEEAVRMPGNREVDRAAVQFGAFNLNGTGDEDVDGDREEPETRAQPPQHSPVAHPRAALPPAPQQAAVPESFPTPKQSAGLPAASIATSAQGLPSPQPLPSAQTAAQYGRYAQAGTQEPSSVPQKPYDAFNQQAPSTQSPFEGYPNQPSQPQAQAQSGAFSSAPTDFSSYYSVDPQQRNAYNNYYQQYGAQGAQGQQDGSASQQRSYSGYNGPQGEGSQFSQSAAQQTQSRYPTAGAGEGSASGHTTPNPATQTQQQGTTQGSQPQPSHPQQPQGANYPYNHPYYGSQFYNSYMNGQYNPYGGGNYGARAGYPPYAMSPGVPFEHASSPAAGAFASTLHGRESALGAGAGLDYNRTGSAQPSQAPQSLGGNSFGHDTFGRGNSYTGQNQQHYSSNQGNQAGTGDDLKPFGESKNAGPSPSLTQAGRPGSATITAPGSMIPPSQQGGYQGYPSHLQQHGAQSGNLYGGGVGGAGGHQVSGQGGQYGGYQGLGYYNTHNSQNRGGWGNNY